MTASLCKHGCIYKYAHDGTLVPHPIEVWLGPIYYSTGGTAFCDQADTVIRVLVQPPPTPVKHTQLTEADSLANKYYYIPKLPITDRYEDGHCMVTVDDGERLYKWGPALTKGSLYYTLYYGSIHIYQCIDCVSTSTPSVAGYNPWVSYESILKHLTYDEIYPALVEDIDRQLSNPHTIQLHAR